MSEVQKPVEETPAVVPETTAAATAAATETPAVTEPVVAATTPAEEPAKATEEAPAAEEPAKEEPAAKEVVPATDGQLGYKAPGLVKSFRFVKRHFWFSEEPVESKQLTSYFQNEKLSFAHPNAAWASQTGKGLLFFAKRTEDKANPAGIINLSDVTDITKDGSNEFIFKLHGQKHTFQAADADERDSWIAAIEAKSAEGKAAKEEIVGCEGYKSELEKFTYFIVLTNGGAAKVPVVAAVAGTAKKVTDEANKAVDAVVEPKEEKKDDKKSRSQSRKRASIFGNFLGKKEEQEEKKDEQKEEDKTEENKEVKKDDAETTPAAVTDAPEVTEPAAAEAAEASTSAAAEPAADAPAEEAKPEEKKAETPVKSKRTSIFGSFFQKFPKEDQDKAKKEAVSETTAVSSTAPQLGDPVDASTSEPIKPETVTATAEDTAEKAEKTEEVTTPTSGNKFLSFMKKSDKAEKIEKAEKAAADAVEKKVDEAVSKADETATAAVDAVVPGLKEKRRTSLFGNLGGKKEKKPEVEGEAPEGETKKSSSLSGLFRKPSKAVKKEPAANPVPEAEPIAEEPVTETQAATTTEQAANGEEPKTTEAPTSEPAPVAATQPVPTAA
ncbi:conserved lysine-rich protein, putative [Trichophyton verrucosum HKI 0517]|uniref:Conserved lysine-rich protein, putative n=1 Tax=Trichophyton verrucosum (strain HKI 0517) TaxID=663202 RepID=D4D688_TRIVH|nr:conserved lysine-rich protein, putative [Trichophyton verrucosum HKI 0517]EFE42659.1 conserved lysine-rich protein, putative [Trichophyton verrucosum HKI 0517]